jgi:hypothetical protein
MMLPALLLAAQGSWPIVRDPPWPPPSVAEQALGDYEACLWKKGDSERGPDPVSARRASAILARAVPACRSERTAARRALLADGSPEHARKTLRDYESDLTDHLRKPKDPDAQN